MRSAHSPRSPSGRSYRALTAASDDSAKQIAGASGRATCTKRRYAQVPLCRWASATTSITGLAMAGRKTRNSMLLDKP